MWFDDLIVFFFRWIYRYGVELKAEKWPRATATVLSSVATDSFYPTAEVAYSYSAEGSRYSGTSKRATLTESSAKKYASRFLVGESAIIRYNPNGPDESLLLAQDQTSAAQL